jgi:hypothetical protein
MPTFGDIGVSQPAASTITMKVATVQLTRNSTVTHQEILSIGDPDSTNGLAAVLSTRPASSAWGVAVRQAMPPLTTYAASTTGQASTTVIATSNAASVQYVCAFSVESTISGPLACGFYSSATLVWPVTVWAGGGNNAVRLAVPWPSYLFKGSTGNDLTFRVPSTGAYQVAVTYWTE